MKLALIAVLLLVLTACGSSGGGGAETGGNEPPVARAVEFSVDQHGVLEVAAPGVLANGSDPDGDSLTAVPRDPPAYGTLDLKPDGSFRYEPAADFHGTDAFSYAASDGELVSAPATVTVTVIPVIPVIPVNRPPVLAAIGHKTGAEGHLLSFSVSATDPDGDPVTITTGPLPSGATFSQGTFSWTPTVTQTGSYQVTFTAEANGLSDTETVTVTVTSVDRPPVLGPTGNKTVAEGQPLTFTVSASDPDGDAVAITAATLPAGATFNGTTFSWTPTFEQAGAHPVTFTATSGALTDSETVTITVTNVDRPPVLAPVGNKSVNQGALLSFTVSASDPEGGLVTITAAPLPAGAAFNGTTFSWTPTSGQAGSHPVTFTAAAGGLSDTETVTVTVHHYFSDDFSDGNFDGWTVVNDSGVLSNWGVSEGRLDQSTSSVGTITGSYFQGSFAVYDGGFGLSDYRVSLRIFPPSLTPTSGSTHGVGVMFRYTDRNNYYRLSLSRSAGFGRLEKRVDGVFSTLAVDGRGFDGGQPLDLRVELAGSTILVYVDGEARFAVEDSDLGTGTIALFTGSTAAFDDVVVDRAAPEPTVFLSTPMAFSVAVTDSQPSPHALQVSAVAVNVPPGGGVFFQLDNERQGVDFSPPYSHTFQNVPPGNHIVEAWLVDAQGAPVPGALTADVNPAVGVGGTFLVAFGDSITSGTGDDQAGDDDSADGRNLNRGYTPLLNDLLSAGLGRPFTVVNEGLGSARASDGAVRLASSLARHPQSQAWLIQFGTNDAAAEVSANAFRSSMRQIVTGLQAAGKMPLLAKVPIRFGACSTCSPFQDPSSEPQNQRIQEYNLVIEELVAEYGIPVVPPDLYAHFDSRPEEYYDRIHPNGIGYVSVANMWWEAIAASGVLEP